MLRLCSVTALRSLPVAYMLQCLTYIRETLYYNPPDMSYYLAHNSH
jgi:hypothetical protein